MAYPTTYANWVTLVKQWLDVEDLSDVQVKTAIDLAQTRCNSDLESFRLQRNILYTWQGLAALSIDGLMPDYDRLYAIYTNRDNDPLEPASFDEYQKYVSTASNSDQILNSEFDYSSIPQFYTVLVGGIFIWPTPAIGDIITVYYYVRDTLLRDANPGVDSGVQSNTFTLYYPDLLLFASCIEMSAFISEDERLAVWEAKYQSRLDFYNLQSKQAKFGLGSAVNRRVPNLGLIT